MVLTEMSSWYPVALARPRVSVSQSKGKDDDGAVDECVPWAKTASSRRVGYTRTCALLTNNSTKPPLRVSALSFHGSYLLLILGLHHMTR